MLSCLKDWVSIDLDWNCDNFFFNKEKEKCFVERWNCLFLFLGNVNFSFVSFRWISNGNVCIGKRLIIL